MVHHIQSTFRSPGDKGTYPFWPSSKTRPQVVLNVAILRMHVNAHSNQTNTEPTPQI